MSRACARGRGAGAHGQVGQVRGESEAHAGEARGPMAGQSGPGRKRGHAGEARGPMARSVRSGAKARAPGRGADPGSRIDRVRTSGRGTGWGSWIDRLRAFRRGAAWSAGLIVTAPSGVAPAHVARRVRCGRGARAPGRRPRGSVGQLRARRARAPSSEALPTALSRSVPSEEGACALERGTAGAQQRGARALVQGEEAEEEVLRPERLP